MNNQQLNIEIPKDKIYIKCLFILNDETYMFFIYNKSQEEIYLLNKDNLFFFKILQKKQIQINLIEYTTKESNENSEKIFLQENLYNTKLIIRNKLFSHKYDFYLYKLFNDIFQYK